jgi:hypothetical protein
VLGIHCRRPAIHTQYVCLCLGNCYSRFTLQLYNIQLKTLFTENKHKHVLTFRTDLNLPSSSSSSLLFSLSFALSPAIHDFGNLLYRPHLFRDTQYFLLGRALYRLPRGHRSLQWETTFLLKALCYHIQYPPPPPKDALVTIPGAVVLNRRFVKKNTQSCHSKNKAVLHQEVYSSCTV